MVASPSARSGRPAHGLRRHRGTRPHTSRRWRSELVELVHGLEEFEDATGLGLVEPGQRKADVHQHVVAGPNVRNVGEADLLGDPAEVDLAHQHVVLGKRLDHEAGDAEAHQPASPPAAASRAAALMARMSGLGSTTMRFPGARSAKGYAQSGGTWEARDSSAMAACPS